MVRMMMHGGGGMMEDVAIIGGLIGVQFVYAGNAVLMSYLMSLGLNSLTIVIFTSFASFLCFTPLSFYYERVVWPKKFSFKLLMRFLLLSLGSASFQSLILKGINLTSPAMGTAMPNLAPALIFIIAWTFRLEKVQLSCKYSRVKIIGTLLCVIGDLTMSIMQSISTTPTPAKEGTLSYLSSLPLYIMFDRQKIIGCFYLLAGVFIMSSTIVLQAFTLVDFPAPMSLCSITSFFGAFMTAAAQVAEYHEFKTGWPILSVRDLIIYSVLSGAVNGICLSFHGWALKKRGPVLVSVFSPISTVCSVIFSVATLGVTINIASYGGMVLMFSGLYFVLWAKGKEGYAEEEEGGIESEFDLEKPLLS